MPGIIYTELKGSGTTGGVQHAKQRSSAEQWLARARSRRQAARQPASCIGPAPRLFPHWTEGAGRRPRLLHLLPHLCQLPDSWALHPLSGCGAVEAAHKLAWAAHVLQVHHQAPVVLRVQRTGNELTAVPSPLSVPRPCMATSPVLLMHAPAQPVPPAPIPAWPC